MGQFRFRLKAVWELRKHLEQEQKDDFAHRQRRLAELESKGRQLEAESKRWSSQYLRNAQKGVSPAELARIGGYLGELDGMILENEKKCISQRSEVEKSRTLLIERIRERKTLDKLYEKQYASYMEEERRKAQNEIEDLVSARLG